MFTKRFFVSALAAAAISFMLLSVFVGCDDCLDIAEKCSSDSDCCSDCCGKWSDGDYRCGGASQCE